MRETKLISKTQNNFDHSLFFYSFFENTKRITNFTKIITERSSIYQTNIRLVLTLRRRALYTLVFCPNIWFALIELNYKISEQS
jgi:hypothetical protein